jgi:CII-binding regulator of phage lambda lysogenization HflD
MDIVRAKSREETLQQLAEELELKDAAIKAALKKTSKKEMALEAALQRKSQQVAELESKIMKLEEETSIDKRFEVQERRFESYEKRLKMLWDQVFDSVIF